MFENEIQKPVCLIERYDFNTTRTVYNEYRLDQSTSFPFEETNLELKQLLQNTIKIEIKYQIINKLPDKSIPS